MPLRQETAGFYHIADWVHQLFFASPLPPKVNGKSLAMTWSIYSFSTSFFFFYREKHWKNRLYAQAVGSWHSLSVQTYYHSNKNGLDNINLTRIPGEGNGNPLQYSCLENLMDGGAWWATVHGVAKSQTWLSDFTNQNSFQPAPGQGGELSLQFGAETGLFQEFSSAQNGAGMWSILWIISKRNGLLGDILIHSWERELSITPA